MKSQIDLSSFVQAVEGKSVEEIRATIAEARQANRKDPAHRDVYLAIVRAGEAVLNERLQPATLTVHIGSEAVEVEAASEGPFLRTGWEFAVLAGRTATKTRAGGLNFLKSTAPSERFGQVNDYVWAEDSEGNRYLFAGVQASGNKGQYGYRVVGHVSTTPLTAQV